jgi:hypothetical protein
VITDSQYLERLHHRIENSSIPIISVAEIKERGNGGLVSCTCAKWLHYTWCQHAFADAYRKKIILGFPPTMDPEKHGSVKPGRPSTMQKIRHGDNKRRRVDVDGASTSTSGA